MRAPGLRNGQSWVLGRGLGCVSRMSESMDLGSVEYFQYQFLKLKYKKSNNKKAQLMTSATHMLHKFCILQINN